MLIFSIDVVGSLRSIIGIKGFLYFSQPLMIIHGMRSIQIVQFITPDMLRYSEMLFNGDLVGFPVDDPVH